MTDILLLILGFFCFVGMAFSLLKKDGVYQYAFLASSVFAGFVFVQLIGLSNNPGLPPGALDKTVFMSILCLLMVYIGASFGKHPYRTFEWQFKQNRLLVASAVLSIIGALFFMQISRLPVELTSASQWTGIVVAYNFFAQAMTYGLAIAVLVYASTSSKAALGIILFDLTFYADRIFVGARRGDTAEILIIIFLALWFKRGWVVPRSIAISAVILGTLFIYSTGDFRSSATEEPLFKTINNINYLENLKQVWNEGGSELINTVYSIEFSDRFDNYDFGAFHWNILIANYVPAQIVGKEFKDALMIASDYGISQLLGHDPTTGSTFTGIADSFHSFWYLGSLKFFIISYILSRIYKSAIRGNVVMQLIYVLMLSNALHSITHHTSWFVSPWVHMAIFLLPALLYARNVKKAVLPRESIDTLRTWTNR